MNKTFLNDSGIVEMIYEGDQDYESVSSCMKQGEELTKKQIEDNKDPIVLVDITKVNHTDTGSRVAAVNALNDIPFRKFAAFGGSMFIKNLANLIIRASGQSSKAKIFETRDDAVTWLLEK